MPVKCSNCGAEVPEVSRFCLSCGKEIPPPKKADAPEADEDNINVPSIVLFMLAFMIFFFAILPIVLGSWIGAALMMGVGVILVIVGFLMWRASRKPVVQKEPERPKVKIKCRYCGTLHNEDATRCVSCGATL